MAAGGAGVGILFLLVSKVTREGFGYGDSWAILALGIYLGLWGVLDVLVGTFCFLAVAALVCLTAKKMSRKHTIPFIPFWRQDICLACWHREINGEESYRKMKNG